MNITSFLVNGGYNRFTSDYSHTYIPDIAQPIPSITKMVSMTKFDDSKTAEQWLYILEKELPK